jgi:hypothetical protein
MLAASAALIEALIQQCRQQGVGPIIISGISLGGFVTNLHHACFNSADAYAPLLAGPLLEDTFLSLLTRRDRKKGLEIAVLAISNPSGSCATPKPYGIQ